MAQKLRSLLNRLSVGTSPSKPNVVQSKTRRSSRPRMECLEERCTPTGTITGHAFVDATGNGLSPDDTPQANVSIKVFADAAGTGVLNSTDPVVATGVTGLDGSYSFTLPAAKYIVAESTPAGFIRTAPTPTSYYSVNLGDGQSIAAGDFDNFQLLNSHLVTNVSFTITDPTGATKTVTNLRGQTQQGDTVTANFTIASTAASAVVVSFAAYDAPGASFDAATAAQQVLVETATGTFAPGASGSLTIHVPDNFYQIDFIAGAPIDHFGPAGGNVFYSAQKRLISADNEGTQAEAPGSLSGVVQDTSGAALIGALVTLTGTNDLGQSVTLTATTDINGAYNFSNLRAGTYSLTASYQSDTLVSSTAGLLNGLPNGTASTTGITGIDLLNGLKDTGFDFVFQAPPAVTPPSGPA
jgi:hypothetical protein